MRSRPVLLAALLVAAALAGCAGSSETTTTAPAPHGWILDCGLGSFERANAAWLQDCEARASHTEGQKQEVWLAVNPTDANNVVIGAKDLNPAASAACVWNGLFVTKDGGQTWHDVLIGGKYSERTSASPYYGYACNTDPMGVFTSDGTLHWVVELYNLGGDNGDGPLGKDPTSGRGIVQPGWKLVLAHSHDGGLTWPDAEATTLEYGDGAAYLNDYSRITVDPTNDAVVTVINTYYPAAGVNTALVPAPPVSVPVNAFGVVCSVLTYKGATAPVQVVPIQPTVVSGTGNPGQLNCNGIAADTNGTLVLGAIAPGNATGGPTTAWFATSTDDGASWSDFTRGFTFAPIPGKFEESGYRTGTSFELAFDNTDGAHAGTLYCITSERTGDKDEADVYVRSSTDHGASWSPAVRVNQDATTSHQFMPNVVVARDGSVHAFWMDKSFDPAHKFIDVVHGLSQDAGRTWTTERVTNVSWDGDLGKHQEGFPFIGDYTAIGAGGDLVWGGFPDASNGKTTVIAAIKVRLH